MASNHFTYGIKMNPILIFHKENEEELYDCTGCACVELDQAHIETLLDTLLTSVSKGLGACCKQSAYQIQFETNTYRPILVRRALTSYRILYTSVITRLN